MTVLACKFGTDVLATTVSGGMAAETLGRSVCGVFGR